MERLRLHDTIRIQFRGVCDFSLGDGTFTLHVNSVDHVKVLTRPIEVGLQVALVSLALVGLVVVGYAVWVSQLKRRVAEKTASLLEVMALLRSTNEAIHDAILVGSPDGEVLEVNHHVEDWFWSGHVLPDH